MPTSHLHLDDSLPVPKTAPTDGAYVLDRSWRIVDINDCALDHLGVSRSEAVGATLWSLAPGLAGTECETHYRLAMESRTVEEFVGPSAAQPGRWLDVRVSDWEINPATAPGAWECAATLILASLALAGLAGYLFTVREFRVKTPEAR